MRKPALGLVCTLLAAGAVQAQDGKPFKAEGWAYGSRNSATGPVEVWNPAKRKLMAGEDLTGGTIRATDPRTYCAMAQAGYGFTWTEMQHEGTDWEQVARMWRTCPHGGAVPGVRVAYTDEREIQHALDMGAMVLVVPDGRFGRGGAGGRCSGPTTRRWAGAAPAAARARATSGATFRAATGRPSTTISSSS